MQQQQKYDFTSSFKEFMVKNGILATAASITIGFATATFVKSFVADVVMPLVFLILVGGTSRISKDTGNFFSRFLASKEFRFTNFASEMITWVLIILSAYLVLEMVRKYLKYQNVSAPIQSNPFAPQQQMPQPIVLIKPPTGVKEEYGGYDSSAKMAQYATF